MTTKLGCWTNKVKVSGYITVDAWKHVSDVNLTEALHEHLNKAIENLGEMFVMDPVLDHGPEWDMEVIASHLEFDLVWDHD